MNKDDRRINTGGGAYIGGNVNTGGGKFVGRDDNGHSGISVDEVARLFEQVFSLIEHHPKLSPTEKADVRQDVEEIREELTNNDPANESFLLRRLRSIGRMAPDILDVVVAAITSPAAGFGMVAKKVAEKAKEAAN